MELVRRVVIVGAVAAIAACSKGSGPGPGKGPGGADCGAVAEALASQTVGNYAPRAERAKAVADLRAQCEGAGLSPADGACIVAATTRFELSRCPRPLLPGLADLARDPTGCHAVAAHMEDIARTQLASAPPELRAALPKILDVVEGSCTSDVWSPEVKGCLIDAPAQDPKGIDGCLAKLSAAQRSQFQDKVMAVVQELKPPPAAPTVPTAPPTATAPPK